jgi:hypothetical protein
MMHADLEGCDDHAVALQELDEPAIRALDRGLRKLPLGRAGLIRGDAQSVTSIGEQSKPFDDPRQQAELRRMKGNRNRAGLFVAYDVDQRCIAVEDHSAARAHRVPCGSWRCFERLFIGEKPHASVGAG